MQRSRTILLAGGFHLMSGVLPCLAADRSAPQLPLPLFSQSPGPSRADVLYLPKGRSYEKR